ALSTCLFFLLPRPPPAPTLFPYTTLFRSGRTPTARCGMTNRSASAAKVRLRDEQCENGHQPHGPAAGPGFLGLDETPHHGIDPRSEEHTSELQSRENLVCRLLLEKKNKMK